MESKNGPEKERGDEPPHRDRSLQLRVAGAILLSLGGLAMMLFVLIRTVASMGPAVQQSLPPEQRADMHSAAYFYFAVAVFFLWTGFGAVLLRRWVRPVMLSLMWPALIVGTFSFVTMALLLPAIREFAATAAGSSPAPGVMGCALGCAFALLFIMYMIMPALFIALFQGDEVRLTLEAHDPSPSWTDACPVPVFALSLWLFLLAFLGLVAPAGKSMSIMGFMLSGRSLVIVTAALFATKLLLAWGIYRVKRPAWWGLLAFYMLFAVSTGISWFRGGFVKNSVIAEGSMPGKQLELLQILSTQYAPLFVVLSVIVIASCLGYIIYVRRFFQAPGEGSPPEKT